MVSVTAVLSALLFDFSSSASSFGQQHEFKADQHPHRWLQTGIFEGTGRNILYLKSDAAGDNAGFRSAISGITGGTTDYFNASPASTGSGATPPLELLLGYDCVMIHTGDGYDNPAILGDILADYVDMGGAVVFSDGFLLALGSAGGRITQAGYSPVGQPGEVLGPSLFTPSYRNDGTTLLYSGIRSFRATVNNRDGSVPLLGSGTQDGSYDDGHMAAAYRPDFRVVYLNGAYCWGSAFPATDCPGGDHILRWVNSCSVSGVEASSSPTTTPSPSVPPGATVSPTVVPTATPAPSSCNLECLNGGACAIHFTGEQLCRCPTDTAGTLCEIAFCPDGNLCLNGAACVANPMKQDAYCCDCDASPKLVAGLTCEKEATSICNETDPNAFCTNSGTCRENPDTGCDCPDMYEGEHCEYMKGTTADVPGCLVDFTPTPSISAAPSTSMKPSISPSISLSPTVSSRPSVSPSVGPTNFPSISALPSSVPSVSLQPSVSPSARPSMQPSVSSAPSFSPSDFPSQQPSVSSAPSLVPSYKPSAFPSSSPAPTVTASASPTSTVRPTVTSDQQTTNGGSDAATDKVPDGLRTTSDAYSQMARRSVAVILSVYWVCWYLV